ncbi:MAG: hypothetical protein KJO80_07825 [Gammaproteobacteria bacterium]|nr:hypothetical protein [Gammaproteobacteria bacterium]NNL00449.1 hypothetical protein [Xanthomonadales bacterium]
MSQNKIFSRIALATTALLLIPLIAMQFTTEVRWDESDFIVMWCLLFGAASLFVLVARKLPRNRRLLVGGFILISFLYIWAELAVGIFTNLGS